jgi:hypothetical protein
MAAAEKRLRGQQRIALQRDLLRAVKVLLKEAGIDAPLTLERIDHLRKMLPEPCVKFLRLRSARELFSSYTEMEPSWLSEAPDPGLLEQVRQHVPPATLATAWTDRWVTAATVASTLGISQDAARRIMDQLPTREVPNPHYRQSDPMRIVRMSDVTAWAAANRTLLESWQRRLTASRQARAAALRRAADDLRAVPDRIRATTNDPASLVCWWLALLNRAAKSGHEGLYSLKDSALRTLVRHGVPHSLSYLKGGDKPRWVWLCDQCRDTADDMGMRPLDYIEVIGPCEDCYVEPAEHRYYDLYELKFRFDGIGTFTFHVPYPVGKEYLPDPSTLPESAFSDRATESDDCWTFGRPLNRVEAAAFSVDEIVRELKAALQRITRAGRTAIRPDR